MACKQIKQKSKSPFTLHFYSLKNKQLTTLPLKSEANVLTKEKGKTKANKKQNK